MSEVSDFELEALKNTCAQCGSTKERCIQGLVWTGVAHFTKHAFKTRTWVAWMEKRACWDPLYLDYLAKNYARGSRRQEGVAAKEAICKCDTHELMAYGCPSAKGKQCRSEQGWAPLR